jgi:hypothetical protein
MVDRKAKEFSSKGLYCEESLQIQKAKDFMYRLDVTNQRVGLVEEDQLVFPHSRG